MGKYESFGECLKRVLEENHLSASEAARLLGYRSRNSIFRILSDTAGDDIKLRFLEQLHHALGASWPDSCWLALQQSLSVEQLGVVRYEANQAFSRVLMAEEERVDYIAHLQLQDGGERQIPLGDFLSDVCGSEKVEIIITSCCDSSLSRLIADKCSAAASRGRLNVRQYIDTAEECVTQNILGVLPLISMPWYNARLVEPDSCPPEMMAVYRLNCIHIQRWDGNGSPSWCICLRYDRENFALYEWQPGLCPAVKVMDRWRFSLELLKPMTRVGQGSDTFVAYTEQFASLEENCTILSIKPDAHFNCIPTNLLEQAVLEGFEQEGLAAGPELVELIEVLKGVHERRFENTMNKRKPTHLVYSLPDMERFMRTGVLSDQFFVQRAYSVEERRQVIRVLREAMLNHPYFNVHILREDAPSPRYEITLYDGKGVLLTDAYTSYDLQKDHSEAMIALPAFMESFRRYFHDELLAHYVRPRAEVLQLLEGLLVMNIQE